MLTILGIGYQCPAHLGRVRGAVVAAVPGAWRGGLPLTARLLQVQLHIVRRGLTQYRCGVLQGDLTEGHCYRSYTVTWLHPSRLDRRAVLGDGVDEDAVPHASRDGEAEPGEIVAL